MGADIELLADLNFSRANLTLPLGTFDTGGCVAYSGVFQGNGFSIKGLVMNNTNDTRCKNAGLFCSLKNATVENLVIDESCSFTGDYAGALSVSVTGSLTVTNTTNKATVSGNIRTGGFIGDVSKTEQGSALSFDGCVNNGIVTGNDSNVGGFVGYISETISMSVSHSTNNGNVTGSGYYVGGFVGNISGNTNISVSYSTNIGNVTGSQRYIGGFIGSFGARTISLIGCINNGFICVGWYVGGLVGQVLGTGVTMTISNCTNNGKVTGFVSVGGLIGFIFSLSDTDTVGIINSVNNATVSAYSGKACGLFCANPHNSGNVRTTLLNSLNKGTIEAQTRDPGYGIANIVTKARSVVSMGSVTGSPNFTFWESSSTDADLFFGLEDKCADCKNEQLIRKKEGLYEVVKTGACVHDLLSNKSVRENYGMVWSSELDVVFKPVIFVSGELDDFFVIVEPGSQLGTVKQLSSFFNDNTYGVVNGDNKTRAVYEPTDQVFETMNVLVGRWVNVSVGAPAQKTEKMVPGETLEQLGQQCGFVPDNFIIVDSNTGDMLSESWVVETSISLRLCHNLSVSGMKNFSDFIDHGTTLGQIANLSKFFSPSFIIFNTSDPETVFDDNTPVCSDIDATISMVTRQEVIVVIDDIANATVDEIKDAILDLIVVPDDEHLWLDVVLEGDDSFRISVIQTDGVTGRVSDVLSDCLEFMN